MNWPSCFRARSEYPGADQVVGQGLTRALMPHLPATDEPAHAAPSVDLGVDAGGQQPSMTQDLTDLRKRRARGHHCGCGRVT